MRFLPAYAVFEHFPAKSGRGSVPKLQKTGGIRAACIDTDYYCHMYSPKNVYPSLPNVLSMACFVIS